MSFLQLHKTCSYLLALTGLFALLLPNELSVVAWPISLLAFAISWRFEPPLVQRERYRLRWTQGTLAGLFAMLILGVSGLYSNAFSLGSYALILLQINKLFNRGENKDYLHIYILSFLMLTLGTLVNSSISYAVCFVLYVVFVTWTLTLFHLRREIEETYLMRHSEELTEGEKIDVSRILRSKRLIRGSFLFSTSLIALLIFLMSSALFFLFPRVGFGLFFQRRRSGLQSGFSNKLKLGNFRRIQLHRKVVLRVEFPEQKGKRVKHLSYYWRGMAYDFYDGTSWHRSRRLFKILPLMRRWRRNQFWLDELPKKLERRSVVQVIYQEPLDVPILFGIDRVFQVQLGMTIPERVRWMVPRVQLDLVSDTLRYQRYGGSSSSLRYEVLSVPHLARPVRRVWLRRRMRGGQSNPQQLNGSHRQQLNGSHRRQRRRERRLRQRRRDEQKLRALFLQLPKQLNPRIRRLAQEITRGARSPAAKARAVRDYLRNHYQYSLVRRSFQGPPLDDFLFHQKRGHCEYFSTAMAILLRTVGIPTRQVTGFMGGSWNAYGGYYAVRQSDAHAWVEVLLPGKGWQRYDPSPRAAPRQGRRWLAALEEYYDALQLRWYKWVIEYDISHQIKAVQALREELSGRTMVWPSLTKQTKARLKQSLLGGGVLLLVLWLLWSRWRKWWRGVERERTVYHSTVSRLYLKGVAFLEGFGVERSLSETPNEFLTRLKEQQPELASPMAQLTELYLALRYQPEGGRRYRLETLHDALAQLKDAIEQQKRERRNGNKS